MIILIDAIIYASVLSVLCVGLTLTYKITNVPNFAHTTFAVLGMYMALITVKIFGLNPYVSIMLAFIVSGATALFLYFFIIRVLQKRGSTYITLIISTLSFDIVMIGVLNILADYISYNFHVTSRDFTLRSYDVLFFNMPLVLFVSIIVLVSLILGLYLLLYKTKFGLIMRASIENTNLAQTSGINTNMVFCISWFLSGGLGGVDMRSTGSCYNKHFITCLSKARCLAC